EGAARALDVFDDLAWFEDRDAPTTLNAKDASRVRLPRFSAPTRATTEAHLRLLPTLKLVEILGASRVASREDSRNASYAMAAPFRSGSYAVAVSGSSSTTGRPLLLSGPQMGFTNPSVAHEIALESPGLTVRGMDVPGVPAILVGATRRIAWGLTTGVADTEDIVMLEADRTKVIVETRELP
ncbi:MAG: hypothetical protein C4293_06665, partial [Nitrospiraceae bacterium]